MKTRIALAALAAVFVVACAVAQPPAPTAGIKRTLLQRSDVGNNMELVVGIAELPPGGAIGRHTHFGVESGLVLEGSFSLEVEGETPKLLKVGDSYTVPAGRVHDAKTVGDGPAKVVASYVVEKGKPLATPAK